MPSLLSDDTGYMSSTSHRPFDLPNHVRQSHEKVNGNGRASSYTSIKAVQSEEPDSYLDVRSGLRYTNGDMLHDASLTSMPNGRTSWSSWDYRSSRNGSTLTVNGNTNGGIENGRRSPAPHHPFPKYTNGDRASIASSINGPHYTNEYISAPATNGEGDLSKKVSIPPPVSTNSHSTGPLMYSTSLMPVNTTPAETATPTQTTKSPHRFSSPPAYPPPLAPSASTSSLPVGPGTLTHRHTLQVPKAGGSRNSREGDDAIHTSGRFSPTGIAAGVRRGSLSLNRRYTQSIHSNMPHEEVVPDEAAIRWAESVRQKRASKRRRKDEEDDERVVVGTKVDQHHVNWVTAYNMLTGIRFTVSRTNAKMDRELTAADFDAKHKFSFDITGNELTPSAKYDFKFKDYAPWVFRHLRAKFKLDPADYLMSLTSKYILSELGSPGKSGSFFYFSRDYKYIIKTIHHAEHKFLRKILKDYYQHVEENPDTLLSQFYGLHRVKIPYGRKIHFVVMNNLFPPHRDIHQTFDLKGSTVGRDYKEEDLEENPRATLKDLNWLRRNLHLEFGPDKKRLFIEQMERDVKLLQKLKIMDYSMLVGVHDLQKGNQENLRDKTLKVFQPGGDTASIDELPTGGPDTRGTLMRTPSKMENARKARELRQIIQQEKPIPMGQTSSRMPDQMEKNTMKREFLFYSDDGGFRATHDDNSPGDEIFFLSIIDCLTHYGTVKKLEHFWKGLSNDKKLISPIRPEPYGDRFISFIESVTKSPEEAARQEQAVPRTNSNTLSAYDGAGAESSRRRSGSQNHAMHMTDTNNSTLQLNEREAKKTERRGDGEEVEHRVLTTARSLSAERTGGMQGQVLPVVEELGEASSTGGRSGRSGRSIEVDQRPFTPAKDDDRPRTPAKDLHARMNGASLRTTISRASLEKELPSLPRVESPQKMK
ncbi:phosphatidylinositol-4-phosphate 5-kinase its3 [Calycina marina]|uniref:1-phosphatidylinositol-4-phosphate 5-kinase n=1 Tax=Calycina marina TaxID=1763456 RepID=A0A9P7ZA96_9HELO|nr:phosphatidylinositol-4-phosphate 5-kinase its3 [Calycina marina]